MGSKLISEATPVRGRFCLNRVFRIREQLFQALSGFVDRVLTGAEFNEFVLRVAQESQVAPRVLQDSLLDLLDNRLTPSQLLQTAWRIAGNLRDLRQGKTVLPWPLNCTQPTWAPLQIIMASLPDDRRYFWLHLRGLAGLPAGARFKMSLARSFGPIFAQRLGFTRSRGKRPFRHLLELGRLRFSALLDPLMEQRWRRIHCGGTLLRWNRRILDYRMRREGATRWNCPHGLVCACYTCRFGYDQCPAGVRPFTATT